MTDTCYNKNKIIKINYCIDLNLEWINRQDIQNKKVLISVKYYTLRHNAPLKMYLMLYENSI